METAIRNVISKLHDLFAHTEVYLAGGALCKHETKDYDLLVFCPLQSYTVLDIIRYLKIEGTIDSFVYHEQYKGDEEDTYHSIYNIEMDGLKIDLLFVSGSYDLGDVLKRFPLSIQRRAKGVDGVITYGQGFQENPIIVYRGGRAEDKYRKYYPDTMFINPDGTERSSYGETDFPF